MMPTSAFLMSPFADCISLSKMFSTSSPTYPASVSVVASATAKGTLDYHYDELIAALQPADLIKFGLIPEFVGRVPIVVGLNALDENALVKILSEPKNALTKQYKTQFKIDDVDLEFEDGALKAVANKAIQLNTGARGLRAILEDLLLDMMYDIPSDKSIERVVINEDCITSKAKPSIIRKKNQAETA